MILAVKRGVVLLASTGMLGQRTHCGVCFCRPGLTPDSQGLYWVAVWTGIFRCTVLLDNLSEEVPTNRLKQLCYPR